MNRLVKQLNKIESFQSLSNSINTKKNIQVAGVNEELYALLLFYVFNSSDKDIVVVTSNLYKAQRLYDRLSGVIEEKYLSFFPQDEFITSEMIAASNEFKLERVNTINDIVEGKRKIIITHTTGVLRYELPKSFWIDSKMDFKVGNDYNLKEIISNLSKYGYKREYTVEKQGEFSLRGGILDVFPLNSDNPFRVEFFDTEIDSIRVFNTTTQRSIEKIENITVFPMYEFFYGEDQKEEIIKKIYKKLEDTDFSDDAKNRIHQDIESIREHIDLDKLNRYMSYLTDEKNTILDYLDNKFLFFLDYQRILEHYETIIDDIRGWYEMTNDYVKMDFDLVKDINLLEADSKLYLDPTIKKYNLKFDEIFKLHTKETTMYNGNLNMFFTDLKKYHNKTTVLINVKNKNGRKHLLELLDDIVPYKILGANDNIFENEINIIVDENAMSFELVMGNIISLNENNILKKQMIKKAKYKKVFKDSKRIGAAKDLKKGDYIVHYDYGIGRFLKLETMEIGGVKNDYLHISYRGEDSLYIPIENIGLIQKYSGSEGVKPKLNKLGGSEWAKTKQRVRKKVKDIAEKLITLYAQREQAKGYKYSEDTELQYEFEQDFEYEETPDQLKAIVDIKNDMESTMPMDRLICGDVGYGKTEVAIRGAFKAVLDNKQVAYLAPTTVLSRQHYYTFKNRLDKYGIKIELLNRFITKAKQKKLLERINIGDVDIVIGTHRILSKDIKFNDLGLLIIDEEQRFGVEHKERIKEMKINVDVLSLTATPIPRTLQMAILGVKNMSVLETPPKNRYPIQTYVLERHTSIIKDAIERELSRDGQVFYLYNKVEDINVVASKIQRLVPEAKVIFAHGKMGRVEIENVIESFLDKEYNVLVSTTIIETGIDIPNANTLIIHDADKLGLSQLYQIRGRVGRSDKIAYAYLMYKKNKILNEKAEKRLKVIKDFTELGSGFKIAVRDLSIRGAGDILGSEQSGFIDTIGIDLYMKILEEEIKKQKGKDVKEEEKSNLKVNIGKYINAKYINDDYVKVEMHKKINNIKSKNDITSLKEEFEDRFGKVDDDIIIYMYEKLFENLSMEKGIERYVETKNNITFIFSESSSEKIDGEDLFVKANEFSKYIRFSYKLKKINIIIDTIKLDKHWLFVICDLLEIM